MSLIARKHTKLNEKQFITFPLPVLGFHILKLLQVFVFTLDPRSGAPLWYGDFAGLLSVACGPADADLARLARVLVLRKTNRINVR